MRNYEAVEQWASSMNAEKAFTELTKLREKYPWLKCDETYNLVAKMYTDLPKIIGIIKHQEKQNMMHRKFIEVNKIADEAIIRAVADKVGIEL